MKRLALLSALLLALFFALLSARGPATSPALAQTPAPGAPTNCTRFSGFPLSIQRERQAGDAALGGESPLCANQRIVAAMNALVGVTSVRVTDNAALSATVPAAGTVRRDGFATAGDGGRAVYNHAPAACSIPGGDGGSQIPSTSGGCWNLDQAEPMRPELFGPPAGTDPSNYDDGPRLLKAYNALCSRTGFAGGTLKLEAKQYYVGSTVMFMTACPVQFVGESPSEVPLATGTWFHINSSAKTPFAVNAVKATTPIGPVAGFSFEHIGIYQDQPVPAGGLYPSTQPGITGYAPKVYPEVFSLGGSGKVRFDDIRAYPVYALIKERNTGRLELGNIYTQCLSYCYDLDQTFDVIHLTGVIHNWDYWAQNVNVDAYKYANADVFRVGRVDGMDGGSIFAINMRSVFSFVPSESGKADGNATRWNLDGIYADATYQAFRVLTSSGTTPQSFPGYLHVNSMQASCHAPGTAGNKPGSAAVYVGPTGAIDIGFGNLTAAFCGGSDASTEGTFSLNNPNRPSTIQVGTMNVSYQGSIRGPFGGLVGGTPPNGGNASTIVFSSPPQVRDNGDVALPNRSFHKIRMAQMPTREDQVGNGAGVTAIPLIREYALESTTSPNTGSTFHLPANPWNGQKVTVTGSQAFVGFSVRTTDGSTVANAPTSLAAYRPVTFTYRTNLNQWWPD